MFFKNILILILFEQFTGASRVDISIKIYLELKDIVS